MTLLLVLTGKQREFGLLLHFRFIINSTHKDSKEKQHIKRSIAFRGL